MGLGTEDRNEVSTTFLNAAGGFLWDKKAEETHPKYKVQKYEFQNKEQERIGAAYDDLLGIITNVTFSERDFGRTMTFCNVSFDVSGENYTISFKDNTAYSQVLYPALLTLDLSKPIKIDPFDFLAKGRDGKPDVKRSGMAIYQDGNKYNKYDFAVPKEFETDANFWRTAKPRDKDRLNEDLSDWFRGEIEEKVIPKYATTEAQPPKPTVEKEAVSEELTPLKMKKALRAYIAKEYPNNELPTSLNAEEIVKWYNLSINFEELPFESDDSESDDLLSELDEVLNS